MVRKATSYDVAARAGVSRTAVSLVLNGRGDGMIAPEKQQAVRDAARELDYRPNAVARSLRSQRTHTIGVVTDAIATQAFGGDLIEGATEVARLHDHLLLVVDSHFDAEREAAAYDTLRNRQVDGFLFAAMGMRPYVPPALLRSAPAVLANCFDPEAAVPAVVADELAGGRAAAQVVVEAGHRDIVLLAGTTDVEAAKHRNEGYAQVLSEAGLTPRAPVPTGWDIDKGYRAAMSVLGSAERPTAVLCANDRVAVGVFLAAARLGLSIPGDLSVVGYDDDENVAPHLVPGLTTVALPHRAIGERAMALLLARIDGVEGDTASELLPCPVRIRESVGPPRS